MFQFKKSMSTYRHTLTVSIFIIPWFLFTGVVSSQDMESPLGLHLTWQFDPATTMTIDWQTEEEQERDGIIRYRKLGEYSWSQAEARQVAFPYSDRIIHRVELTGLEPDATYEFQAGNFTRMYQFRTMPENLDDRPVVFAAGGDTRHRKEWMLNTNRAVMEYDIDFVVWGGDFAYADGRGDRLYRWYEWFEANYEGLISEDGRVVPVLTALGNHEVLGGYHSRNDRRDWLPEYEQNDASRMMIAPYFYSLFAFPGQPGYGILDFGDYLSIVLLDSEHTNPIEGKQTEWLESELRERARRKVPHIFPVHHVTAYPSHRSYTGSISTSIRDNWVPLYEKYGVRVVLENHDHTYKRTHPIRNGAIADDGIVYIGDGAWGTNPREGNSSDEWYIDQFASVRHGIIVTLDNDTQDYIMVDENGNVIDTYTNTR